MTIPARFVPVSQTSFSQRATPAFVPSFSPYLDRLRPVPVGVFLYADCRQLLAIVRRKARETELRRVRTSGRPGGYRDVLDKSRNGRCERAREKEKEQRRRKLTDIEKRPHGRKIERVKEGEGLTEKRKRLRERIRDRKVVTRGWLDQTRGGKTTPRIIAFPNPRKEDRVIYNDTLVPSNGSDRRYVRRNVLMVFAQRQSRRRDL